MLLNLPQQLLQFQDKKVLADADLVKGMEKRVEKRRDTAM